MWTLAFLYLARTQTPPDSNWWEFVFAPNKVSSLLKGKKNDRDNYPRTVGGLGAPT
jgi:hypothetical protein